MHVYIQHRLIIRRNSKSSHQESNPWPSRCQLDALTTELKGGLVVSKAIQLGSNVTHVLPFCRLKYVHNKVRMNMWKVKWWLGLNENKSWAFKIFWVLYLSTIHLFSFNPSRHFTYHITLSCNINELTAEWYCQPTSRSSIYAATFTKNYLILPLLFSSAIHSYLDWTQLFPQPYTPGSMKENKQTYQAHQYRHNLTTHLS